MTTTYFRFFVNLKERDMAFAMISIGGSGEEKQVTGGFMEFWTDFASGNRITTNNNGTPPTFRDVPESPTFRYPGEMDMHILYTIHQKNLSIYGGEEKILPPEGEEFKYMRDLLMKDMEMQVSTGYLYLDKSLTGRLFFLKPEIIFPPGFSKSQSHVSVISRSIIFPVLASAEDLRRKNKTG